MMGYAFAGLTGVMGATMTLAVVLSEFGPVGGPVGAFAIGIVAGVFWTVIGLLLFLER